MRRYGVWMGPMASSSDPNTTVVNAQKLTEDDYIDIAPPPPPPVGTGGSAGYAEDWANPYVNRPPMVAVDDTRTSDFSWNKLFDTARTGMTSLVNIFGQPVTPSGQVLAPPPAPGIGLAGWVAIGVAGVVVLGVGARLLANRAGSTGRRRRYAGYRRRRSR